MNTNNEEIWDVVRIQLYIILSSVIFSTRMVDHVKTLCIGYFIFVVLNYYYLH